MLVKGEYGYVLVPPERFELPAPAFVAQCSNPNELRWCIKFVSSCIPLIATIFPCNASRPGQDKSLGILVQLATFCPWTLRAQVGVEPITFYYKVPSKNTE